jgi:hypothetical protein
MVSDQISYAVHRGGQNMTSSTYNAISSSTSNVVFNVQVPSEQTLIDRRVLWRATIVLKLTTSAFVPIGQSPINYGVADALSPFPLHQLCSVMTSTINNNSVSINIRDVLPAMLRFNDSRELQRYNGTTTVAYDTVGEYSGPVGSNLNPLGSWSNCADNDLVQRGSWVLDGIFSDALATLALTNAAGINAGVAFYVKFTVAEPLLLSPWIFADPKSNSQAIYGIQNLNYVFNFGDASRVWRSAGQNIGANGSYVSNGQGGGTAALPAIQSVSGCELVFNFLTPHPDDLMSSKNTVPFYELPRYISQVSSSSATASQQIGNAFTLRSNNIQLNQIPDKLIIQVRKPMGSQTPTDPDCFLCVSGLSINFNNQSGILASATQQDLWRYSVENGCNQSWLEFSGYASCPGGPANFAGRKQAMSGSMVVLEFGKDIQLTESFYASGSLGNFNLQVNLSCYNQTPNNYAGQNLELVLITMNSGIFVCEKGTSAVYTGILTKQDCLDATSQPGVSSSYVSRMVGGSFLDRIKSAMSSPLVRQLKELLKQHGGEYGKKAVDVANAVGLGRAGGKLMNHLK